MVLKTVLLQASIANFPKSFSHLSIIHVLTRQVLYSLVSECHSSLPTNTIPNSLAISRSSCSSPLKTLHSDQMFINLRSSFLKTLNILFCIPDRAWPSPRMITLSSTSLTARTSSRRTERQPQIAIKRTRTMTRPSSSRTRTSTRPGSRSAGAPAWPSAPSSGSTWTS